MSAMTLVIGNRNYSSWSLRPWILMKHLGLDFDEVQLLLDTDAFRREIVKWSPAGRVPVLRHGDLVVRDSLAICEYACELAGRGWPTDRARRARARSLAAEMHSGFQALRNEWPMNIRALGRRTNPSDALHANVARIDEAWSDARARSAGSDPWLFGEYSVADAMFAPVALRFRTYGASLSATSTAYVQQVIGDPLLAPWIAQAVKEPWIVEADEAGV